MEKQKVCEICNSSIKVDEISIPSEDVFRVCEKCKSELEDKKWILTCDCEEDNCMTICRDCMVSLDSLEKWKIILENLR